MTTKIILAGFGGQGILFAGRLIAYAGMLKGKEVSWLPSYGPEMRGGTANCHVIISDEKIASPIIQNPDILIALNGPSFEKFENDVVPGGIILYDSSLISEKAGRTDITAHPIPATQMAVDMKLDSLANMIMLGNLAKVLAEIELDDMKNAMKKTVPARKADLIETNNKVLEAGFAI